LLAAVSGAALLAGAQGQDPAPQPPVEFTGRIRCGGEVRQGSTDTVTLADGEATLRRNRGYAWQQSASMSDPRLEGTHYQSWESDSYTLPRMVAGPAVGWGTQRIVNDEGAWQGSWTEFTPSDGTPAPSWTTVLTGEGGYEGLTAIWVATYLTGGACGADVRGVIFEGEVPIAEAFTNQ
jgi:hypothetical protein